MRVRHLDHEPVLDHRRRRQAAGFEDVGAGLGEHAREILQQAVAIPRVDLDLDDERGGLIAFPGDVCEAFGVLALERRVGTVLAMDRDAAAE